MYFGAWVCELGGKKRQNRLYVFCKRNYVLRNEHNCVITRKKYIQVWVWLNLANKDNPISCRIGSAEDSMIFTICNAACLWMIKFKQPSEEMRKMQIDLLKGIPCCDKICKIFNVLIMIVGSCQVNNWINKSVPKCQSSIIKAF